jgi:CARDB protein
MEMKTKLSKMLALAFLWALVSPCTLAGDSKVDLTTRRAIYVTSSNTAIDLKNDKYVAAGATINVNAHQGQNCQGTGCTFNLGIIAFKSGGSSTLSTYGQYTGSFGIVGNTIIFGNTERTKQQVLPVKLSYGKNVITFTIDPQKKIVETDETNNTFTVTIVLH